MNLFSFSYLRGGLWNFVKKHLSDEIKSRNELRVLNLLRGIFRIFFYVPYIIQHWSGHIRNSGPYMTIFVATQTYTLSFPHKQKQHLLNLKHRYPQR